MALKAAALGWPAEAAIAKATSHVLASHLQDAAPLELRLADGTPVALPAPAGVGTFRNGRRPGFCARCGHLAGCFLGSACGPWPIYWLSSSRWIRRSWFWKTSSAICIVSISALVSSPPPALIR